MRNRRVAAASVHERLGEANDSVERRAELMRGVREEFVLERVRLRELLVARVKFAGEQLGGAAGACVAPGQDERLHDDHRDDRFAQDPWADNEVSRLREVPERAEEEQTETRGKQDNVRRTRADEIATDGVEAEQDDDEIEDLKRLEHRTEDQVKRCQEHHDAHDDGHCVANAARGSGNAAGEKVMEDR